MCAGDGLTQRELSQKVGTLEPTTLVAIKSMVESGLVERRRDSSDGRKLNIVLTRKGRTLRDVCVPKAREVNAAATSGLSDNDLKKLFRMLSKIRANLERNIEEDRR